MKFLIIFAVAGAVANSIHYVASKYLVTQYKIGPFTATFIVLTMLGLIALPFIVFTPVPPAPGAMPYLIGAVALALCGFFAVMGSLLRADASSAGPLVGAKALFVAGIESLLDKEPVGGTIVLAACMSVAGILLLGQGDRWSLHPRDLLRPGMALMLLAALLFASSDYLLKPTLQHWDGNSWAVCLYLNAGLGLAAGLGLVVMLLRQRGVAGMPGALQWSMFRGVEPTLLISAISLFVSTLLLIKAIAVTGEVTLTNVVYNVRTLFIVLVMAFLVLGHKSTVEQVGWRAYMFRAGGAMLTLGAVAVALLAQ